MLFVITLEHPPELCFARKEYTAEGKLWQDSIEERAKSLGIKPGAEQCGWLKDKYGVSWQIFPTIMDEMIKKDLVSRQIE